MKTWKENELAKAAKNKYMREWRRKNPEKVRENQKKYWLRKAQKMLVEQGGNNLGVLEQKGGAPDES